MYRDCFFCLYTCAGSAEYFKGSTRCFSSITSLESVAFSTPSQNSSLQHRLNTSLIKKMMKTCVVKRGGHLENWFFEKIEMFLHESSKTTINNPKLITFNWLKGQNLNVRNVLKEQQLKQLWKCQETYILIL